jgi:hypothetical protein
VAVAAGDRAGSNGGANWHPSFVPQLPQSFLRKSQMQQALAAAA